MEGRVQGQPHEGGDTTHNTADFTVFSPGISSSNTHTPSQLQQQLQQEKKSVPSGGSNVTTPPASNGERRRISCEDIQLVQNLIERCLQLYMNQKEVINTLLQRAKIEPGFTSLVWQKLEEQNPDFFKAYYIRLKLKRQIGAFNLLLEQQVKLMQRMCPSKATLPSMQNGIDVAQVHNMPIGYPVAAPPLPVQNHPNVVPMRISSSNHHIFTSGTPMAEHFTSSPGRNGAMDMASQVPLVLPQGSHILTMSSEFATSSAPVLQGASSFPFGGMANPTDMSGIGMDGPANIPLEASFGSGDAHGQNSMGAFQIPAEADASTGRESLGFLGQLPRSFSLSDLTAEMTNSSDILGNYSGSPFLSEYIQSPERDGLDDEKLADHITDVSYEDLMDD